jgi:hypothetical protein
MKYLSCVYTVLNVACTILIVDRHPVSNGLRRVWQRLAPSSAVSNRGIGAKGRAERFPALCFVPTRSGEFTLPSQTSGNGALRSRFLELHLSRNLVFHDILGFALHQLFSRKLKLGKRRKITSLTLLSFSRKLMCSESTD